MSKNYSEERGGGGRGELHFCGTIVVICQIDLQSLHKSLRQRQRIRQVPTLGQHPIRSIPD